MHKLLVLVAALLLSSAVSAQELNARVTVMAGQIQVMLVWRQSRI